jgi:hypothetical protein
MPFLTGSSPVLRCGLVAVLVLGVSGPALARSDPPWLALHAQSRLALADLLRPQGVVEETGAATTAVMPRTVLVGFTGGMERRDSRRSGVVRLSRTVVEQLPDTPGLEARVYSNFAWRRAARDVRSLALEPGAAPPLIVVYGHSLGAGAITKFARELSRHDLEVALAVYIDAFTLRSPRVPGNVRYAVNVYQRGGLLRGLPLRGRGRLTIDQPERTQLLANLRVRPESGHFGWHWNLVQPLLYRHHHRIGHDRRLHGFLLEIVSWTAGLEGAAP